MKRLFLIFAFVGSAWANTIATSKNDAGGLFVLTDIKCKGEKTYVAYTTSQSSSTKFGCWFMDDEFIHIQWDAVGLRSYPIQNWSIKVKSYD